MSDLVPTVPVELLIKANDAVSRDHGKHDTPDVTISIVCALADNHGPEELIAVSYRLRALAKLIGENHANSWTLNVAGKSYTLAHESLFRAAATTPPSNCKRWSQMLRLIQKSSCGMH